jgi:hypothetical protein
LIKGKVSLHAWAQCLAEPRRAKSGRLADPYMIGLRT